MKTCWPRQLLTVILVCSFSCAPLAEEAPDPAMAMLNVSGKVQVNGSAIPRGTALFSGDRIQTQSDSRRQHHRRGVVGPAKAEHAGRIPGRCG